MFYQTGFLSYLILPEGFKVGDKIKLSQTKPNSQLSGSALDYGQAAALKNIRSGVNVFNVEL